MAKKILFLCRYTSSSLGEQVNFSLNRKVIGILNTFKYIGYDTSILKTNTGINYSKRKNTVYNELDVSIYDFSSNRKYLPRLINYLIGIYNNYKFLKNNQIKFEYILFWDFLPDTYLPIFFAKIHPQKTILDVEERIKFDPEAKYHFKLFEDIASNNYKGYKGLASSNGLNIYSKSSITINGFFGQSIQEENLCFEFLQQYLEPHRKRIFFAARFDSNRGIDLIIKLIQLDLENPQFTFIICGFGSTKILNDLKLIPHPYLEVNYEISREKYLEKLINSEISLNILKDTEFSRYSFPSKLIEYLCLGGEIFSNVYYEEIQCKYHSINLKPELIYSSLKLFINDPSNTKNVDLNKNLMTLYSIKNKSSMLLNLLSDE